MRYVEAAALADTYDVVAIGSGFGSLFFLKGFLRQRPKARVLILEWGRFNSHQWQIENQRNSDVSGETLLDNRSGKPWLFTIGVGGGTNCWWAQTPRLHPADFEMQTRYGVGRDWPISYNDLVPYYVEAEQIILVAGPDDLSSVWPGTPRYPQPPHNMTTADRLMKAAMPDRHFVVPNARLTVPVNGRSACCATGNCGLCPVNAKFTAENSLDSVLSHPQVDICVSAKVERLHVEGGRLKRALFRKEGREFAAAGDLFVLGANALFSPHILLRSGIGGHGIGQYLCEKMFGLVEVKLDGLKHFDGGTATTCFNTSLLDGEHRRTRGAVTLFVENRFVYGLRTEFGRWREVLPIAFYVEDIPQATNSVALGNNDLPLLERFSYTDYAKKSIGAMLDALPDILRPLPVESIELREMLPATGHIQCTTRMGSTSADSVVDRDLVHHTLRNLVIVGSSTFPTTGSVNPSLTIAALSLRAADRLTRSTQ
jgi:choline dehydrogenase-like flavoprotein